MQVNRLILKKIKFMKSYYSFCKNLAMELDVDLLSSINQIIQTVSSWTSKKQS